MIPSPPGVTTPQGRAGLEAFLADPRRALLALDFDGTVAPIVDDPALARPLPQALAVLDRLVPLIGRAAIVTGRPAQAVAEYGDLASREGLRQLLVLGQYGAERWTAGELTVPTPDARIERVRVLLPGLLRDLGAPEGVSVEDKVLALAVHTRRSADPAAAFDALKGPLRNLAERSGLRLEPGRYVLELRPPGMDKGLAMRALIEDSAAASVLFAGDDLGDLAAFDAVDEFRRDGGAGLLVCSGSREVSALLERADVVVDGPPGVAALLGWLAERIEEAAAP